MTGVFVFLFGICIGSFLNVCIYRLPLGQSVVSPGSHCPTCNAKIGWTENIPLVSYLLLKGKCKSCKSPIPVRYWFVELITGLSWVYLYQFFGWGWQFAAGIVLVSYLIVVFMTDIETGLIPDAITFPGMGAGIIFSLIAPEVIHETTWTGAFIQSVGGLVAGGGVLLLTGFVGNWLFKKDSMGGGDIKLMGLLGAFLGIQKVFFVFFLAPILALPVALFVRFFRKEDTIVFGPYLAVAGFLFYLFGDEIIHYVLG